VDSEAAQQVMLNMSDRRGEDPMSAFRALCKAQADALSGDSDDGGPMTWKF
jgi:hypothetical protein